MSSSSAPELPFPREPGAPYRVCLVCLGNICRSPMAETVLRAELTAAGLEGAVVVDSAGTGDWHVGDAMDPGARAALARRGYDGSNPEAHRARQFQPSWLARRDLILAMDARNLADLRRMAGTQDTDRIRLFGESGGLTGAGGAFPLGASLRTFFGAALGGCHALSRRRLRHLVRGYLGSLPGGSLLVLRAAPRAATSCQADLAADLDLVIGALLRRQGGVTTR